MNGTTVPPNTPVLVSATADAETKKKEEGLAKTRLVYDDDKLSPVSRVFLYCPSSYLNTRSLTTSLWGVRRRRGLNFQGTQSIYKSWQIFGWVTLLLLLLLRQFLLPRQYRVLELGEGEECREAQQ